MNKLHSLDDLRACRAQCEKALARETKKILVCGGTGCVAGGSDDGQVVAAEVDDVVLQEQPSHGRHLAIVIRA